MECSLAKLEGCDQETIDAITGGNGKTIDEMTELQNEICADGDTAGDSGCDEKCDVLGMSDCYSILDTNDPEFLCRYINREVFIPREIIREKKHSAVLVRYLPPLPSPHQT